MLVVVHDGDIQLLFQAGFDFETLGRLYILEVDTAEGRRYGLDGLDKLVGVFFVDFNIEYVDAGKYLEQQSFALHYRLAGQSTDVAQTQHGRTVGDDGYQISLGRIFIRRIGVLLYLETGFGYARRIGQGEVALCTVWLGGNDFDFPGFAFAVIF